MKLEKRIDLEIVENETRFVFNIPDNSPLTTCISACWKTLDALRAMLEESIKANKPAEKAEDHQEGDVVLD